MWIIGKVQTANETNESDLIRALSSFLRFCIIEEDYVPKEMVIRYLYESAKTKAHNLVGDYILMLREKITFGQAETYFKEFLNYFYTWEGYTKETLEYQLTVIYTAIVHNALLSVDIEKYKDCLLYTSPSPRDRTRSRMPSSA